MDLRFLICEIASDRPETQLALRNLYNVVADAPVSTGLWFYDAEMSDEEIFRDIVSSDYDMFYFHCDDGNIGRTLHVCEMVKKALPYVVTIFGGPEISYDTEQFMRIHREIDYAFVGDGEKVLYEFMLTTLREEYAYRDVAGLAYWDGGVKVNEPGAPKPMDELDFPYVRLGLEPGEQAPYETSRGYFDRSYYNRFMPDYKPSALPVSRVITELRYFAHREASEVYFTDECFNFDAHRANRIWEHIVSNDDGKITYRFKIDGEMLDDESFRILGRARRGLMRFDVDIESTNPEPLSLSGRNENVYQAIFKIEKLIVESGVDVNLVQRVGLPRETIGLFARAFNKLYALKPQKLTAETLKLSRGTVLRSMADKFSYKYDSEAPYEVISNDSLSATELIRIKDSVRTANHYSCGAFARSLERIMRDTELRPFQFFDALSEHIKDMDTEGLEIASNSASSASETEGISELEFDFGALLSFANAEYRELGIESKFDSFKEVFMSDLTDALPGNIALRFDWKGWEIDA